MTNYAAIFRYLRPLCAGLLLTSFAPRAAMAAYGYYGYETFGYGYMPVPVVVAPGPPLLTVENQYFDVTVGGVSRLCATHPEMCEAPKLNQRLHQLQRARVIGLSLGWVGLGTAIVGPIISTSVNCARADTYCRPNDWVVLGTVVGGLAMGITGLALAPSTNNIVEFVNEMNRQNPQRPVQLRLGMSQSPVGPGRMANGAQVLATANF